MYKKIISTIAGEPSGTEKAAGFDHDPEGMEVIYDYYCCLYPDNAYTGLDLGSGGKKIRKIRFLPVLNSIQAMLGGKFQGSNVNETAGFEDLYIVTKIPHQGWNTVVLKNSKSYRYIRYIGAPGSHGLIGKIKYYSAHNTDQPGSSSIEYEVNGIPFGAEPHPRTGKGYDAPYKNGPDVFLTFLRHARETNFPVFLNSQAKNTGFPHQHDFLELFYLKRGLCYHLYHNKISCLLAGDLLVIPPGTTHCYFGGINLHLFNILLYPDLLPDVIREDLTALSGLTKLFTKPFHFHLESVLLDKIHLDYDAQQEISPLVETLERGFQEKKPGYRSSSYALLIFLFMKLSGYMEHHLRETSQEHHSKRRFALIAKALNFIEKNYASISDVREILDHLQISYSRLAHLFNEELGISIYDYLTRYRISQACQKLIQGEEKMTEIAFGVGYHTHSYFNMIFKHLIGYSPSEFRQDCRSMT